jgi:hypothetical protein
MRAAETLIHNDFYKVEMMPDLVRGCIRVMATTKPVAAPLNFVEQRFTSESCYWVHHCWARAIRWMLRKKWLRKLVPYPIEALVSAREVVLEPSTFQWPEKLLDNIHAQIAELHSNGQKPTLIIVGRQVECELMAEIHFSVMPIIQQDRQNQTMSYRGIPVVQTNKLEHDAVLVISQKA